MAAIVDPKQAQSDAARWSVEAERALLGALVLDAQTAWPLVVDVVNAEHFTRNEHRVIFAAIAELVATEIVPDAATVVDHLAVAGKLEEAGGRDYIVDLVEETPSAANARSYALRVREHADSARVIEILNQGVAKAREGTAEEALEFVGRALECFLDVGGIRTAKPLPIEPVAAWAHRAPPAPRDWVMEGLIPAGRVTSLYGNGGLGKTLLAVQIGLHVSMSRSLFDIPVSGGPVIGIFCEDEQEELERRGRAACAGEEIDLADVDRFYPFSRDGQNNLLCTFERDEIKLTAFYHELEATIAEIQPRLVILDTAADLFAGDFLSTPHVRQFLKVALGGLCVRHGCAILLLAHPSTSAMNSGEGGGFSTAWNNSVRSRLYFRRPRSKDQEAVADRRVLEVRKANYAPDGTAIPLVWQSGYFVPDPEPIDESGEEAPRKPAPVTKLAFAIHEYMRRSGGLAVPFRQIADHVAKVGAIDPGEKPETARKQIQRTIAALCDAGLIRRCEIPRGSYRLVAEEASS